MAIYNILESRKAFAITFIMRIYRSSDLIAPPRTESTFIYAQMLKESSLSRSRIAPEIKQPA